MGVETDSEQRRKIMAANFLGIGLFILLIASIAGVVAGMALNNEKVRNSSIIALVIVLILYGLMTVVFH